MLKKRLALLIVPLLAALAIFPIALEPHQAQAASPAWLEVTASPADKGTVFVNGYEGPYVSLNSVGDWIELQAWPNQWSEFVGWYAEGIGYISYDSYYAFTLNMDMTIRGEFSTPPTPPTPTYPLTVQAGVGGMIYCGAISSDWSAWTLADYNIPEGFYAAVVANPYDGYHFTGWTDGYGNYVSGDNPYYFYVYGENYFLANFEADTPIRTVVTWPGEGSGLMPDYSVTSGDTFYLPECTYDAPPGKEFDRWDAGAAGEAIVVNYDMTITALWRDIPTYQVFFDSNGADGYMSDPVYQAGYSFTVPECAFTPPVGKRFAGWYFVGSQIVQPGTVLTVNAPITLVAQWEDTTCKVSFDANGGSGEMAAQELVYGSQLTLPACSFTAPEGQQFKAWDQGAPGEQITLTYDTTVKAVWEDVPAQTTTSSSGSASGTGSGDANLGTTTSSNSSGTAQQIASELPIIPILLGVIAVALIAIFILLLVRGKKR